MPTKHRRETILFTAQESKNLRREAAEQGSTLSNVVRAKLSLPLFRRGKQLKENPSPETLAQRMRRAEKKDR